MTWLELRDVLAEHKPFQNSTGNFRGEPWDKPWMPSITNSRQSPDECQRFERHWRTSELTYIVWSYNTPVAWRTGRGEWFVTETNYSKTTARHLGKLRTAIAALS